MIHERIAFTEVGFSLDSGFLNILLKTIIPSSSKKNQDWVKITAMGALNSELCTVIKLPLGRSAVCRAPLATSGLLIKKTA